MLPPANGSTPNNAPDPDAISARGWRQGSILTRDLLDLGSESWSVLVEESTHGIVITQDCDLVNSSFEDEPFTEILLAKAAARPDGNLKWAKNPRKIQLDIDGKCFDASIHERHRLDRALLCEHSPTSDSVLDEENVRQLRSWLARRYKRAAFPDEFNRRIGGVQSKISKKLKKAPDLTAIYIIIRDIELSSDEEYEIAVRATMLPEHFNDWGRQEKHQESFDAVVALLNSADGVTVKEHLLVSEEEVTLNDLRYLKRWDWDSLTLRKGTIEPAEEEP